MITESPETDFHLRKGMANAVPLFLEVMYRGFIVLFKCEWI
jgi:hypothetical protein